MTIVTKSNTYSFCFILVRPMLPQNIGAVARAMKTMGFNDLRLVNPCSHLCTEAKMLAHASTEILENAKVFESFENALKDIDFVIGTTQRVRTKYTDYHHIEDLVNIISEKGNSIKSVAIVFGGEESGLSNSELSLCDIITSISLKTKYPSLNLSQAAMIYAYKLSELNGKKDKKPLRKANDESWKVLKSNIQSILINELDFKEDDLIYTRINERISLLSETDVNILHSIIAAFHKRKKS